MMWMDCNRMGECMCMVSKTTLQLFNNLSFWQVLFRANNSALQQWHEQNGIMTNDKAAWNWDTTTCCNSYTLLSEFYAMSCFFSLRRTILLDMQCTYSMFCLTHIIFFMLRVLLICKKQAHVALTATCT